MYLNVVSKYNEHEVIRRLAEGDRQAFEILYNYYYLPVFRFAKKILKEQDAAEDISTEVFIKLWNKRGDFDHEMKVKSFLFIATKNACLNWVRSKKRQEKRESAFENSLGTQTEDDFMQHEITERMYQYLDEEIDQLPEKMRNILGLQLKGYKNEEIAGELGISEKTVRNLKVEAMKILKVAVLKRDLTVWALVLFHFFENGR